MSEELAPRPPRLSFTEMTELVLPQHANALGSVFGGVVMSWIDICGSICAQRHTGHVVVTALVDDLVFRTPLHVGDVACIHGRVNGAFRTSVEIEVCVEREHLATRERELCVEALLTFVALDGARAPTAVPAVLAETDDDARRQRDAAARRTARLDKKPAGKDAAR